MSAFVHKAVEPDNLSVKGKKRYSALIGAVTGAWPGRNGQARVELKYDGVYAQFVWTEHEGWYAISRTGQRLKSVSDDILDVFYKKGLPDRRYNGELWLPNTQHQVINGLARKQSPQRLELVLFDSFDPEQPDETLAERLDYLIEGGPVSKARHLVPEDVLTEADLYDLAKEWTGRSSAYDGLMLKDLNGLYKPGPGKDGEVVKIKPRKSGDFLVVDTTEGEGNRKGGIGALVVSLGGENTSEVGTGLSMADVFDRGRDYFLGKIVEIEYLALSALGKLREPSYKRVRDDKAEPDVLDFTKGEED
ncbi:hypothetical protein [Chryseobacterium sp.]|uniref:hypothetical protein n=1 Tax=Chryseobacterium sp. TaxID=1871047 RepID=UPI00321B7926